jgi:hypothetical protein
MLDTSAKEPIPLPPSHKIWKGIEFFLDVLRRETAQNIQNPVLTTDWGVGFANHFFLRTPYLIPGQTLRNRWLLCFGGRAMLEICIAECL